MTRQRIAGRGPPSRQRNGECSIQRSTGQDVLGLHDEARAARRTALGVVGSEADSVQRRASSFRSILMERGHRVAAAVEEEGLGERTVFHADQPHSAADRHLAKATGSCGPGPV
jgi:hypothetical protein